MSQDFERLIEKLKTAGVKFPDGEPDRAHFHSHGQLRDTFLVYRQGYGRRREIYSTAVRWIFDCNDGLGVILAAPVRQLARCKGLEFDYTDEHGEGGWGLVVYDTESRDRTRAHQAALEAEWMAEDTAAAPPPGEGAP